MDNACEKRYGLIHIHRLCHDTDDSLGTFLTFVVSTQARHVYKIKRL